ncbi:MAG: cyclic-di-AMP receptor [Anaerolineales bacterium]|jgi:uncharacterized protein YaaQ
MKLIFIIIRDEDGDNVLQSLVDSGFRVTRVASTGGFLKRGNLTLMSGVADDQVERLIDLLRKSCCPPDEPEHRATVFVVDMPYYEQI